MATHMHDREITRAVAQPELIDKFDVREWVSSKVYRRGVDYFKNGRVVFFELGDDDSIRAEVEGTETYSVHIVWDEAGEPVVDCTCPFDWEPLCKHAVAAILYWQDRGDAGVCAEEEDHDHEGEDEILPEWSFDRKGYIAEIAMLEMKKRRQKKVLDSIRILRRPKGGGCGEYEVTSGTVDDSYRVIVRDLVYHGQTTCSCMDYLTNELGTCKHIELVKDCLERRAGRTEKARQSWRRRHQDQHVWISLKPRNTYERALSPYEEIHIHSGDEAIRRRLFSERSSKGSPWTGDGYLCDLGRDKTAHERFSEAIAAIRGLLKRRFHSDIMVADHVMMLLEEIDARRSWEKRVNDIVLSPEKSPEWTAVKGGLSMKLYDYQEKGTLFAVAGRRSFIGDDMGLGKTVQAIAAALLIKRLSGIKKVLIFCPASLKFQWKREIEKICGEKAQIVSGNKLTREDIYGNCGAMFLIVNYELIFRDEENLRRLGADMIILDEAQRIKNWETKTAKGIKRLKSEFALILTGTPFENRLVELHSLCEFLHPRALGPMWRLMPTYGNLDADDKLIGYSNLSDLRGKIAPFFLRREKDAVQGQLPDKVVNEYSVEIGSAQRPYHDDYEATMARILSRAKRRPLTPEEMKRVFMCLTSMRIISNALAQHDWEKYRSEVDAPGPLTLKQIRGFHSPKLMEFRSIMEELLDKPGAKFVIFSQWERMLLLAEASIRDLLMERKMESVIFSGALPTGKRGAVIDRFINDPKLRIFFSTDAGGLGLNLQESASYVINLEMPWNPAVLEQRIARVHRIGQSRTVNVVNLISTECIEERVYGAVQNKRLLFDGLFDGRTEEVKFERGSSFVERLKDIIGDVDAGEGEDPSPEEVDELSGGPQVDAAAKGGGQEPESEGMDVDLSGLVQFLGSLVGNSEMAACRPSSFRVSIHREGDDVSLKLKSPPKDLLVGMKKALKGLSDMMGA